MELAQRSRPANHGAGDERTLRSSLIVCPCPDHWMARLSITDTPIHGFKAQGGIPTVSSYPVRSPGVLVVAGRRLAAVVVTGTEAVAVHVLLHVQDLAGKQAGQSQAVHHG